MAQKNQPDVSRETTGKDSVSTRSPRAGAQRATAGAQAARKGSSRKPAMPSMGGSLGGEMKKGGLGRGLASLIPTGDAKPRLGAGAADIILGGGAGADQSRNKVADIDSSDVPQVAHENSTGATDSTNSTTGSTADRKATVGKRTSNRHRDVSKGTTHLGPNRGKKVAVSDSGHGQNVPEVNAPINEPTNEFGATYQELAITNIRPNAKQPRTNFDPDALAELVHSIREFGVMQPIVVRYSPDGATDFELIMGERRFRASTEAGLDVIPAIIRQTDDSAMLRDALLENIHRAELNPLEEAAAYQQLLEEFGVTQAQLAEKIGRSRPLITNMIRLLQLPVAVQHRVAAGVLSAGHARALLGVKVGAEAQERLALRIVAEGLSVRATEEAVTALNADGGDKKPKRRKQSTSTLQPEVKQWAEDFGDVLDTKVSVQMGAKKGKIVVEFGGKDDFDRIIEILNNNNLS